MTSARMAKAGAHGFSLDVEFELEPGLTAMYGPSGSGKTLILEALAGFVQPDSGRILLNDAILFDAAARVSLPPHRRGCGYVAQQDSLFPHMTVRQNLAFAAYRSPRVERTRRVAEALEKFELAQAAEKRPAEITPPERRRGAVARALLAWPKLLLLDDRGYDEALLRKVRAFPGPVLAVLSDLDLCCAAADRLMLIDEGRIVRRGSPREVLERPECAAAARILGIPNVFECTITALDPGRHSSRLEFGGFTIDGPHMPGHFRGDRVRMAIRPEDLRVHAREGDGSRDGIAVDLLRVSNRRRMVRMEFTGGLSVDVPSEEYEAKKDAQAWLVEIPAEKLRAL